MSALIHCVYCSAATRDFAPPDLAEVLRTARENNERLQLTGMLLYAEDTFFQVLEGEAQTVDALYAKIERDARHANVTKIIHEPIPHRYFDAWTMGFSRVSREDFAAPTGSNDFFGTGRCFAELDAGRAKKLLEAFRAGRWRKTLSGSRRVAA